MTADDLGRIVAYWCGRLQMDPWQITVRIEDEINGRPSINACCSAVADYLTATIRFKREFIETANKQERNETIVHELLHCLFRDLEQSWEAADQFLSPAVEDMFHERIRHEYEQLVDRLAVAIVALDAE